MSTVAGAASLDYDTVLVANRGEIAAAIVRSARALGLRTVAVFSEADRGAPHVALADEAIRLGATPARDYLAPERVLDAAHRAGAQAIHPGYGMLSEDAGFARAVEAAGLRWIGPTAEQLERFGSKHSARQLAEQMGVPLVPGTGLLASVAAAQAAAQAIGYPVMLKASGGGGGIGLAVCHSPQDLEESFARSGRRAAASFGGEQGLFLERFLAAARHVEVQVFGDGAGEILVLGDRDCTLQRRHQKVIEEAPAPALPVAVRERLAGSARALCGAVGYRSAGTVEFLYDPERQEASFLEVNPRLQVEHPVTEEVLGVDLVAWMLRLAGGDRRMFAAPAPAPRPGAHAVEARIYAEDPAADFRPSAGLITEVNFPGGVRVESWIDAGTEVTSAYDPLLAKLVARGESRSEALDRLAVALGATRIGGIRTNLGLLRAALASPELREATHTTATLAGIEDPDPRIEVLRPGTMTTVQDWPGRRGLWPVGVPPSGPMDDRSFRLGNLTLGNLEGAPGLECTLEGPLLRFSAAATVCLCGAPAPSTLDGEPVEHWHPTRVPAGGVLAVGTAEGPGLRTYVLVAGGLDVPLHLGSAATFTLGGFGGHGGRALRAGDVLLPDDRETGPPRPVAIGERPVLGPTWELAVSEGPQAAPDFLTAEDVELLYATDWEVHFNSARTGVRLIGPRLRWARRDGGEAGLHPSNIHDTPYSVGAIDLTGDTPILLGPDGPSLGGFVCPATVVTAERWKLGQLRPGDTVRLRAVSESTARALRAWPGSWRAEPAPALPLPTTPGLGVPTTPGLGVPTTPARPELPRGGLDQGILARRPEGPGGPEVTYRRSGDDNLLVEYGPMVLDLGLRLRVHALAERIAAERAPGIIELTAGIRSLQIHVDPDLLTVRGALSLAQAVEEELPATEELAVPSRRVHLPLSWDDPATREAIARYVAGVRPDAPWCPWNIEFIRRINGLPDVETVRRIVYEAEYLVLGLGDVYLGAPVATPLDPRHRLVTTKYNPARTWTPENAVGIGGAYLCIYGMEGPGGYQLVGRTVPVWSRFRAGGSFEPGIPWLLRPFDRICWHPVGAEELLEQRADLHAGRLALDIEPGTFSLAEHRDRLAGEADSIEAFGAAQRAAFAAEREAWAAAGEFDARTPPAAAADPSAARAVTVPPGGILLEAPLAASVWTVEVRPGDSVLAGERLLTLEAMKTETALDSPIAGSVTDVLVGPGDQVVSGAALVVVVPT